MKEKQKQNKNYDTIQANVIRIRTYILQNALLTAESYFSINIGIDTPNIQLHI